MGWKKLFRRKLVDKNEEITELNRVLSTLDLTLLGIGSTLGTGIYVLAGQVAKANAGPAVIFSFIIAAVVSVLAGLCYAEFGARVPRAGSVYSYSYVCMGEVVAFSMGWSLIMEHVIGVASVAKACSDYADAIIPNRAMSNAFKQVGSINVNLLGEYVDFFAFGITIMLTLTLTFGVKESSFFNNIFTILNLFVVAFVIIAGAFYSSLDNWSISPSNAVPCNNISAAYFVSPGRIGTGGFFPFGYKGVVSGAIICFYGFIGFDIIATTGEEAKNPKRAIPLSIILSLLFICLSYVGISTVMTTMLPYYCQDEKVPLSYAFSYVGFIAGKWIVIIGALCGLITSMLGSAFPLSRIVYCMAKDGLLCGFLSYVHPSFKIPFWATLSSGFLSASVAAIFSLSTLIEMISIITLMPYILVALCVIILRYRKDDEESEATSEPEIVSAQMWFHQIFNANNQKLPTKVSTSYSATATIIYCVACFLFHGTHIIGEQIDLTPNWKFFSFITLQVSLGLLLVLVLISIALQPEPQTKLSFKVPLVPWVPGLSIFINAYLVLEVSWKIWIAFAVWMTLGMLVYIYALISKRVDVAYQQLYEEYHSHIESSPDQQGPNETKSSLQPIQGHDEPLEGKEKNMSVFDTIQALEQQQ